MKKKQKTKMILTESCNLNGSQMYNEYLWAGFNMLQA